MEFCLDANRLLNAFRSPQRKSAVREDLYPDFFGGVIFCSRRDHSEYLLRHSS